MAHRFIYLFFSFILGIPTYTDFPHIVSTECSDFICQEKYKPFQSPKSEYVRKYSVAVKQPELPAIWVKFGKDQWKRGFAWLSSKNKQLYYDRFSNRFTECILSLCSQPCATVRPRSASFLYWGDVVRWLLGKHCSLPLQYICIYRYRYIHTLDRERERDRETQRHRDRDIDR